MDDDRKFYEHALVAVLYAVQANGGDLEQLYQKVAAGIIGNSIRPRPQDQEPVLALVRKAVNDISA
jgi:hypothetical protein